MASITTADSGEGILTEEEAFVRLQDVLLFNAAGARSDDLNREDKRLGRALLDNEEYSKAQCRAFASAVHVSAAYDDSPVWKLREHQ